MGHYDHGIESSPTRTRTWKYGIKIRCVTNYTIGLFRWRVFAKKAFLSRTADSLRCAHILCNSEIVKSVIFLFFDVFSRKGQVYEAVLATFGRSNDGK